MRFLITGTAGFIGFHLARRLLEDGHQVVGVDNFSDYYDITLKDGRNAILEGYEGFRVERVALENAEALNAAWEKARPEVVVHLAAQAGVRYSIDHPEVYVASNLVGTFNVLEAARHYPVKHLLAASTSSAYGANTEMPFRETDKAVHPMTLYAATKSATELMGHSYAHLFGTPTTFFRFFTVYGPWGRPDMALFKFAKLMLEGSRSRFTARARCRVTLPLSRTWSRRSCGWSMWCPAQPRRSRAIPCPTRPRSGWSTSAAASPAR